MATNPEPGTSKTPDAGSVKMKGIMRKTAAELFDDKDEDTGSPHTPGALPTATQDIVVELINNAAVMPKSSDKIANLRKVQELIVYKSPDLLDNFLDEMLAYQSDPSKDVKRFIIGFMEETCKKDFECLPKVIPNMMLLLADDDVNVQKKVILTVSSMFKIALAWISKTKKSRPEMMDVWNTLKELEILLYDLLESVNDGIRTHVVKFLEGLTLTLSKRTADSEVPKKQEKDMSLDQVPDGNDILDVAKLEAQGNKAFSSLLQFQSSPHISSINLMTVMNALSNIAKQRPDFFDQVVQSYEALHVNLPPTLAKSQVSSVRKNLKIQLMGLLKHPASVDFIPQITTLLTDLGASQSEIAKNMPKEENRKRKVPQEPSSSFSSKKSKIEVDDDDELVTPWVDRSSKKPKADPAQKQTAIDVTADDILPRLTPQNVADLVLLSMVMLPDNMPAAFQSTYTPIAAAGTETQIGHIARLMATQLTMAGMGKGLGELQMQALKRSKKENTLADDEQPSSPKQTIQTVVGLKTEQEETTVVKKSKISQLPLPPVSRKIKQFQLSKVTKSFSCEALQAMSNQAVDRIIRNERAAAAGHVEPHRVKLLASITTLFGKSLKKNLQEYVFSDLRVRHDVAFAWLYQEYAHCQGYCGSQLQGTVSNMNSYDECLSKLLVGLLDLNDHHGDCLFHRLLLEAPVLTDKAISTIRDYCNIPEHTESGMKTLTQLINSRPAHRLRFLDVMMDFTANPNSEVRNIAIKSAQELHTAGQMQEGIETYANSQLKKLLQPKPVVNIKEEDEADTWTEETIKGYLYLHLALLPTNHRLIHELANIYTATSADIKRTILRVLEAPVRGMGMDSPELLTLVENCPKGSETLVMRVIHILTDKAVPSPELVERIRDLYHKRVPDVRFLIPVLNGLSKSEVMEALPKLIKLNPKVVKEVFNRLMGSHVSSDSVYHSPLTPVELLVALHNIDPVKCDMKTIIKAANLCFSERTIYTQEVLAIVMQQLMEQEPLPTLLMRTVIQSFSMYPRLIGFVLNILQRLIVKKVWKQKKVWEGFIRCCQRAKPQSFQVLLQLPANQLKDVFQTCPDLQAPLLEHVKGFTDNQRNHINKSVMAVLEQDNSGLDLPAEEKEVTESVSNGKDKDEEKEGIETGQRIESVASATGQKTSSGQKIVTLTAGVPASSSPQRVEKSGGIKISLPSSAKEKEKEREKEKDKDAEAFDLDISKEKRKIKEKRVEDESGEVKKTKSSKKDSVEDEESKSRSSTRSSKSSTSSTSSTRRSSSKK